jgi:hypothetical protein
VQALQGDFQGRRGQQSRLDKYPESIKIMCTHFGLVLVRKLRIKVKTNRKANEL